MKVWRKYRKVKPYRHTKNKLKTTLNCFVGLSGVYLIYRKKKSETKYTLSYIGHSSTNLYKTIYRHFQSWDDPLLYRVTYKNQLTRYDFLIGTVVTGKKEAPLLEEALIKYYRPKANKQKLDGLLDPDGFVAGFTASDTYHMNRFLKLKAHKMPCVK